MVGKTMPFMPMATPPKVLVVNGKDDPGSNTIDPMKQLKALLPKNPFYIPKEKVDEITQKLNISTDDLLQKLIPIAKEFARPLISNYKVGAAGLGASGAIYLGVNLEFPGFPLNQTVHGEQFVTTNAFNHGETGLKSLAISAAPCGHCRQWLNELGAPLNILLPGKKPGPLASYLNDAFGPGDLGVKGGLLTPQNNHLNASVSGHPLFHVAFQAANRSYSPYSNSPSGVGLQTKDGKLYAGAYLENAAFNPSLSPLQGALIALVADGKSYDSIAEAHLVEKKGAKSGQELVTRNLLKSVAPNAIFHKTTVS